MAVKQQAQLDLTGDLIAKSVKSFVLSKRYTNILVKCSIFNIIYRRLEMEESELKTRKYKGIPFAVLKNPKTAKQPLVQSYLSWLDGIKDAMDNNYLKEIFLFMKNAAEETVEVYNFKLKYNTDPNYENKRTLVHVQDDTMALLQVLCDLGKHKKLEKVKVVIEFTYFEETPAEYEPPGFLPASQPNCVKVSVCDKFLGRVVTGFHKVTCRAHGLLEADRAFTPLPSSLAANEQESECSFASEENSKIEKLGEGITGVEIQEKNAAAPKKPAPKFNTSNITISDHGEQDTSLMSNDCSEDLVPTSGYINCICEIGIPLGDIEIVRCTRCDRQYHGPCHGYIRDRQVDVNFRCYRCGTTDTMLLEFTAKDRVLFVRMRLVLYFLGKKKELPEHIMNLLSESDQQKVLDKVKAFEVYDVETKTFNEAYWEQLITIFFKVGDSQYLV